VIPGFNFGKRFNRLTMASRRPKACLLLNDGSATVKIVILSPPAVAFGYADDYAIS
jgi:hypothetical protein